MAPLIVYFIPVLVAWSQVLAGYSFFGTCGMNHLDIRIER